MEGTVYLTNIEAEDLKKIIEEDAFEAKTSKFVVVGEDMDYLGSGNILLVLDNVIDVKERKEICVTVEINVEELLENDAFWRAIEKYVEEQEKERRRFNLMKRMLEVYKSQKEIQERVKGF